MTLIVGLKVSKKVQSKGSPPEEHLVLAADSMGSSSVDDTKCDNIHKLFVVGEKKDFVLMGCGQGAGIEFVARNISDMPLESLEDGSKKVLAVADVCNDFDRKGVLSFILAGRQMDEKKKRIRLGFSKINTTGYCSHFDKVIPKAKGFDINFAFSVDGSGSGHVINYMIGLTETGKEYLHDLADALVLIFEFSRKGAKDSAVNDKLQYGIISQDNVSVLYHPDVNFISEESYTMYLNMMCGTNIPVLTDEAKDEDGKKIIQARYDLDFILQNFYNSLDSDLRDYAALRKVYTSWSEEYANDDSAKENFEYIRERRALAKKNVSVAADSLVAKGLDSLLGYLNDFDERKKQSAERALKVRDEYKA